MEIFWNVWCYCWVCKASIFLFFVLRSRRSVKFTLRKKNKITNFWFFYSRLGSFSRIKKYWSILHYSVTRLKTKQCLISSNERFTSRSCNQSFGSWFADYTVVNKYDNKYTTSGVCHSSGPGQKKTWRRFGFSCLSKVILKFCSVINKFQESVNVLLI